MNNRKRYWLFMSPYAEGQPSGGIHDFYGSYHDKDVADEAGTHALRMNSIVPVTWYHVWDSETGMIVSEGEI